MADAQVPGNLTDGLGPLKSWLLELRRL